MIIAQVFGDNCPVGVEEEGEGFLREEEEGREVRKRTLVLVRTVSLVLGPLINSNIV